MGSGEMWSRSVLETRVAGPLISLAQAVHVTVISIFKLSHSLADFDFTREIVRFLTCLYTY
jgi:hypothetical protein